ncbi:glutamate formimidoyltransferase [Paludibaculum fermentans]|uniref:Formimidoyltransferase-cyclodeaminase n=2 Tax=Paludibaculum fermentans TaxID=1473598 RepID=A0A7S7SHH0_PALFE|nr:glutamate formimidoyltransferase [Paludibaculum fermentans]QOY84939.1 glutamate formimidoyltransferase [Paludibaculum fermentans]
MTRKLVECIPNFSEGRDRAKVDAIASAIAALPGALVLDLELDADHNRSVITFVAPPETVMEAALAGAAKAVETIDLTVHSGVHPRIGAVDVMPFVPLEGMTLAECVQIAERAAAEMWKRFRVPAYLYEAAARRPDRTNLENIRRGQFEGLRAEVLTNPDRAPDFGDPQLHPTAGATVVGARKFLIAYNINLGTPDIEIAKRIAKGIRHSSGGFRYVKSMGVPLASRNLAQVSMNLTDFEQTPIHRVFECVRSEAARYGVPVLGSEIVGLIPKKALEATADFYLRFENFQPGLVLENRVAEATAQRAPMADFLDALAAATPTPGGGSAAAASGAMSAALGAMVARLSKQDPAPFEADRAFLTEAVQRDADAYSAVVAAYKRPKDERAPFVNAAMEGATTVPLEVLEHTAALSARLAALAESSPSKFASDVITARALAQAAMTGARANVDINLAYLPEGEFRVSVEARLASL